MASCAMWASGVLQLVDPQPANMADCAGVVLMSSAEWVQVSIVPTFSTVFAIPSSADLVGMWMAGFTLPAIGTMVAWACAKIADMFN